MTTHNTSDRERLTARIRALLEKSRPDQLQRLMTDIMESGQPARPTHNATERLQ